MGKRSTGRELPRLQNVRRVSLLKKLVQNSASLHDAGSFDNLQFFPHLGV